MIQKKICLLGAFAVGKTSLIRRYVHSLFSDSYLTTVGVKIDKKVLTVGSNPLSLMLWDIAGEDSFSSIRQAYLRGLSGYIMVIDGTRQHSCQVALEHYHTVRHSIGELPAVFVINKADLKHQWQLDAQDFHHLHKPGYPVLETSARLNEGVDEMFMALAQQLVVNHG